MIPYIFASITVIALIIGQVLFKKAALALNGQPLARAYENPETLTTLATAVGVYGAATIMWVLALRDLPLSRAYMLTAGGFIIVPLLGHYLFSEPLSPRFLLGAAMIAVGVVLTNWT